MAVSVWGTKIGMTRIYEGAQATGVTVVEVLPNEVLEVKDAERHGYAALKVAVGPAKRAKNISKALNGEYQKADVAPRRFMREIPVIEGIEQGGKVTVEQLQKDAVVHVTGTSKGRGFAGVMKRHNFSGGPASHGHQTHRHGGAIGCRMDPGKVFKNKKMPGHMGAAQVTVRNLSILDIDPERHLVLIRGAIPGPNGGLVSIQQQ